MFLFKVKKHIGVYCILCCIIFLLLSTCNKKASGLEQALRFAGDNRLELEKVLNYYKTDYRDSLKYKAAVFLIVNMPYKYSLQSEQSDHFIQELYKTASDNSCPGEKAIEILEQKYGTLDINKCQKIYDAHVISALYLINNIEQAFQSWQATEWSKQICFEDFCEQILPYRVAYEPLENWREAYRNKFQPVLDSFLVNKKDPVEAMTLLYDTIVKLNWIFFQNNPLPHMGSVNLLDNRIGHCNDRTVFASFVMRALGIPGGTDCILQYPDRADRGHAWNYVTDTLGQCVQYTLYDQRPGDTLAIPQKKGRVYRKCFGIQYNSLPFIISNQHEIPPLLNNPFIKDVSSDYFSPAQITINTGNHNKNNKILYLSVFDNKEWVPVAWAQIRNRQAVFDFIEREIVYLPVLYESKETITGSFSPLLMKTDGSVLPIKPDIGVTQQLVLDRKYPIQPWWQWIKHRPVGGKFQGANNPDFKNPVTFHTITQGLDMRWHRIKVEDASKYRYVRYLSAKGGMCNMAEVEFISSNDTILRGKIIGTEGSFYNELKDTKIAVFDGDPLTYYDAKEYDNSWAGLDLGKAQVIKTIRYLFRNDDNNIRIGDEYELFYWNENQWNSLGKQIATKDTLQYINCPTGTLFLLHNHSRGKEERIFTYENGKQIFW